MSGPTKRELFERVAAHLLEQNARSTTTFYVEERCAYRGANNLRCAVGCLIDDGYYSVDLEWNPVGCPHVRSSVEKSIGRSLAGDEVDMLMELQAIHDEAPVDMWRKRIASLRCFFGRDEVA